MIKEEDVREALKEVIDPELGLNIVDLGLIYAVKVGEGLVEVKMTLTSPGCPLAPVIDSMVRGALGDLPGVEKIGLELVWDPPWVPDMITEEARAELGMD